MPTTNHYFGYDQFHFLDGYIKTIELDYLDIMISYNFDNKNLHRLDGPALIIKRYYRYDNYYYIYGHFLGINLSENEFLQAKNKKLKELIFT